MNKNKKILLLIALALGGYVVYMRMKNKKEKAPKQADPLDKTLLPQGIIDDTPNFGDGGGGVGLSNEGKVVEKIAPKKTKRAKKKVDTYCTNLLTNPRAAGHYSRNSRQRANRINSYAAGY